MKPSCRVVEAGSNGAGRTIQAFCRAGGQLLPPPADSIHDARPAAGEVIGRAGRSLLETILNSGAGQIAEPGTPGTAGGDVRRRGRQPGRVRLPDRQLRIELPRSRRKNAGEAAASAFEALRNGGETGAGISGALLKAVSTRFGSQHAISAAGVDLEGHKHVLGIQLGAAENAAASCNAAPHWLRNVIGQPPKDGRMPAHRTRSLMRAAWRSPQAEEGPARMKWLAGLIERDHPEAAASLRERLEETFAIRPHDVSPGLRRPLAATNTIGSPQAGVRKKTARVRRRRDGAMALRWAAGAFLPTERNFRKIIGHPDP